MMNKYLILFFLFFFGIVSSQNISIQWEGTHRFDYGFGKKSELPFFKNQGYTIENGIPYLIYKKDNPEKNLFITDFVWTKATAEEVKLLENATIPEKNSFDIGYYNDDKNLFSASIKVAAFKKEKNEIYKLISFRETQDTSITSKNIQGNVVGSTENPLKSGTFYKIKVDTSGVFKITHQFLRDIGINPANINPKNFRIYGNGGVMLPEHNQDTKYAALQENAILVNGENDGKWDEADVAYFYAKGPHGFNLYDLNNGNGYKRIETRADSSQNLINVYEEYSYYFLNFDLGEGKRMTNENITPPLELIKRFDDYQFINLEKNNVLGVGRVWVGDFFTTPKNIVFKTRSPILSTDEIIVNSRVFSYNSQGNKITTAVNGGNSETTQMSTSAAPYIEIKYKKYLQNLQGNEIKFTITPDITANPNGLFYFDYAEVQYKEELKFNDSQMNFRSFDIVEGSGNTYGFTISNAAGIEKVWNVSDVTNVKNVVKNNTGTSEFEFGYIADNLYFNNEFVCFKMAAAYTPSFVGKVDNQDLSSLQNIDYLIISTPEMMTQAQRLADYHQNVSNYNVAVVDVFKIYNEFSSGSQDITAIRDFVTRLNSPSGSLKYVFILGDTSFDFKNRLQNNTNIVPSYQSESSVNFSSSFVTDDYFVMTAPQSIYNTNITNILPTIPIGRLTAATPKEAQLLIDKTLSYYNAKPGQSTPFGDWRMKLHFVVDDDNDDRYAPNPPSPPNTNPLTNASFHDAMDFVIKNNFEINSDKTEYNIRKLYMDSFPAITTAGGQRFPQVTQGISNAMGNSLYLFYFGHGGINGWAQERILTPTEIDAFNNYNNVFSRFPMVSTITCEFTLWDDPHTFSAGEQVLKLKTGGAATMITSSRAITVNTGRNFTMNFTNSIFKLQNNDFLNLGDAYLNAKRTYSGINPDFLKVNYLGDPAMKLSRPKENIVIDNIDTPIPGQIRALDHVKITGHVNKEDGTLDSNFNGKVVINIFDKRLNKKTLNNDGNLTPILNYTEEGSAIVKTSATVINGNFLAEFYVPKDINFELGTGRILAYADNKVYDVFNNKNIQVGGINENGVNDNQPPKVKLYMNNTNFANGGITNENPTLIACVTDDFGINSTGAGIGHDITVYLDGEIINTIVLNDFYAPGEGNGCVNPTLQDFQKGNVSYPFRNLAPGEHTLTFKVWDINNNSTTETLNFIVKNQQQENLVMNRLLNWPNPFTDKTYIHFEHNCDDILDVSVQIFTITGKLVRTISLPVTSDPYMQGYRTPKTAIEWDGKDDFGDAVGKGTYIYKVFIKSQNQDKCKGSASGIEKLVILR